MCTRKFVDVADAIDEAIEFIIDDPQNNICVVICDPSTILPFRFPLILQCHKVPGDEPLDAAVSGTSNTVNILPTPWLDSFLFFLFNERPLRVNVFHIFSETFFKQTNHVL